VVAGNPLVSIPGEARLRQALHALDALVCLDLFMNATGREADLLLPTTSWVERWDIATTTVMFQPTALLQHSGRLRAAPGGARSETRILADLSLALGRPLWRSAVLTHLWRCFPWDAAFTAMSRAASLLTRWWYGGASGIPWPRPQPGRYLGRGPRTPGHRLRFWHPDLATEPQRLAAYAATLAPSGATPGPDASPTFTLICRRRRLGHNSWLHGAVRDGRAEEAAWMAPADCARLGLSSGSVIMLQTASATLQVPVLAVADVSAGTVVLPHGLPSVNVNALIPTGLDMLEPISGQHRMTGIPVQVTPVPLP
jgi:formate dehydrogenase